MPKSLGLVVFVLLPSVALSAPARFQKVSEHYYYLQSAEPTPNVGVFIADSGVLLVNPPSETDSAPILEALKKITVRPVRWLVDTDYRREPGWTPGQSAEILISQAAFERSRGDTPRPPEGTSSAPTKPDEKRAAAPVPGSFVFAHQMRIFPGGTEVRLFAPQGKSRTLDAVVFVAAEKVLQVGGIFQPGSFPTLNDSPGAGAAVGWIEGLKQVIDLVPLLKSAMPQPKPETGTAEEKTLEESIFVIPAHGALSNLQELKLTLEAAQRVRTEITRAIAGKRNRDSIPTLPSIAQYRNWRNFESFVLQLYDDLH